MHIKRFLHNLLRSTIHVKRFNTLNLLINALISEKKLSLTQLGRALKNKAQEKNNIKRCDRFLGNKKLHEKRLSIYQKINHSKITLFYAAKDKQYNHAKVLKVFLESWPKTPEIALLSKPSQQ